MRHASTVLLALSLACSGGNNNPPESDARIDTTIVGDARVDARPQDSTVRDTAVRDTTVRDTTTRDTASEVATPDGAFGDFPTQAGQLVITEIMANPVLLDDDIGEWFEIYNPGTRALDLQSCVISDGANNPNRHTIASTLMVAPGAYVTIAASANPGFTPTYFTGQRVGWLNNSGRDLMTIACNGVVIDTAAYTDAVAGASYSLSPNHLSATDNDVAANWCLGVSVYNARPVDGGTVRDAAAETGSVDAAHDAEIDADINDANVSDAADAGMSDAAPQDANVPMAEGDRGTPNLANPSCAN